MTERIIPGGPAIQYSGTGSVRVIPGGPAIQEDAAVVPAICIDSTGTLAYTTTAGASDRKLYINAGAIYARLAAAANDRILTLNGSGDMVAT